MKSGRRTAVNDSGVDSENASRFRTLSDKQNSNVALSGTGGPSDGSGSAEVSTVKEVC